MRARQNPSQSFQGWEWRITDEEVSSTCCRLHVGSLILHPTTTLHLLPILHPPAILHAPPSFCAIPPGQGKLPCPASPGHWASLSLGSCLQIHTVAESFGSHHLTGPNCSMKAPGQKSCSLGEQTQEMFPRVEQKSKISLFPLSTSEDVPLAALLTPGGGDLRSIRRFCPDTWISHVLT